MALVEAKLTLFQVQVKFVFVDTPEATRSHLAEASEVLDSVDVIGAMRQHTEYRYFSGSTTSAFATHASWSEAASIQFYSVLGKEADLFAALRNGQAEQAKWVRTASGFTQYTE